MGRSLAPGSDELRALFPRPAVRAYLDTASYGLPPLATIEVLKRALSAWSEGSADWVCDWEPAGEEARALFAPLVGAPPDEIALLPAVSVGAGIVAASLGPGDEVLIPDDEFRSILFPLLAAERAKGVRIRRVPFAFLADAVRPSTTLVSTSHVRSNGGAVQNLEAVAAAARDVGARVLVDATHSAGVLRLEAARLGLHYVLAAAYKHLLCPRGVAFMRVARECWESLAPFSSSWRSAADPYIGYYGGDLTDLAPTAARFDVSLAWHPWVGAAESLRLLARTDAAEREAWAVGLASAAAARLGAAPTGSSIVGLPVRVEPEEMRRRLRAASIAASLKAGQVRLSFHLYNTPEDLESAVDALRPFH